MHSVEDVDEDVRLPHLATFKPPSHSGSTRKSKMEKEEENGANACCEQGPVSKGLGPAEASKRAGAP